MKNIHLLPTDKPSRFSLASSGKYHLTNQLHDNSPNFTNQNIYITSDEMIKEGDYGLSKLNEIIKFHSSYDYKCYAKIILTTDVDLIEDCVQAIDDEFLEWFVKNTNCESIEAEKGFADGTSYGYNFLDYKIIIPKKELKITDCSNKNCQSGVINGKNPKPCRKCNPKEETRQETLEEAAEKVFNEFPLRSESLNELAKEKFIAGAKFQQGRSYSEEELKQAFYAGLRKAYALKNYSQCWEEWFEEFKKK